MNRNLFFISSIILFAIALYAINNWIMIIDVSQAKSVYMSNKNSKIAKVKAYHKSAKDNYIFSAEWASVQSMEYGIVDGPDIDLSSTYIIYPYVENGASYSMYIDVVNNGNETLSILDNYITNPEFVIVNPLNELLPGENQLVELAYNASNSNASGSYRIYSNDPDQSEIICQLVGNVDGANVGEPAPNFNLEIVANGNGYFQLSDYMGQVVVLAFFAPN